MREKIRGEEGMELTPGLKDIINENRKKPKCKLVGTDGNVFALSGRVQSALNRAGLQDQAKEFGERLWKCESYEAALKLMKEYVDVS